MRILSDMEDTVNVLINEYFGIDQFYKSFLINFMRLFDKITIKKVLFTK